MANILFPLWKGRWVYRESFLPLSGPDGKVADIQLLYPAEEILEVLDATLAKRYEAGKDYELVDGCLRLPEDSAIPHMTWEEYYPETPIPGGSFAKNGGGNIRFSEGTFYHERQLVVSYRHEGTFPGAIPECKLDKLPNVAQKLENGQPVRVVFFGDSITARANATAMTGISPFQADWCQMTSEALEEHYGSCVTMINTAVGGTGTQWGVETAQERAVDHNPDLLVLGFGMNDGSTVSVDVYLENLQKIMDMVHAVNPACDVVIISTMLPNREAQGFWGRQKEYEGDLLTMEREGVAVCDMTAMHEALLSRKAYRDMTGNNVNHPNDFLSRVYAQTLLKTLGVG